MLALTAALLLAAAPAAERLPPAEAVYAGIDELITGSQRVPETAMDALKRFRYALRRYYADAGGRYPASPEALVPGYLPAVPVLRLPGHAETATISVVRDRAFDKDIPGAVKDSGGWLYFAGEGSANRGLLLIDCPHISPEGLEYSGY